MSYLPHSKMLRCAQHDNCVAPLLCHPEHIRYAQCKLREGSLSSGVEMLRCTQHNSGVTYLIPSSSLAINNWRISFVPAPISPSLAFRHIFSTSKSVR